jgi:hypothetical protein
MEASLNSLAWHAVSPDQSPHNQSTTFGSFRNCPKTYDIPVQSILREASPSGELYLVFSLRLDAPMMDLTIMLILVN